MATPRRVPPPPRACLLLVTLLLIQACGGRGGESAAPVDCGTSDLRQSGYDAKAIDCFWQAFSAGRSVIWRATQLTIEGDPIPLTLSFDPKTGLVATRDVMADKFSSQVDRRVWTWRCTGIKRAPWAMDATRTFVQLRDCTGDGGATSFP